MPEAPRILFLDNPTERVMIVPHLKSMGAQVEMPETIPQAVAALKRSRREKKPFDLVWTEMWFGSDMYAGRPVVEAALEDPLDGSRKPRVLIPSSPLWYEGEFRDLEVMIMERDEITLGKMREIVSGLTAPQD